MLLFKKIREKRIDEIIDRVNKKNVFSSLKISVLI